MSIKAENFVEENKEDVILSSHTGCLGIDCESDDVENAIQEYKLTL